MASLFTASANPTLLSHNRRLLSPSVLSSINPRHSISFISSSPKLAFSLLASPQQIPDEWGEKSDLTPEPASEPDPTQSDDEWGSNSSDASSPSAQITDEWGEKGDPEPEPASAPDPAQYEDEWGSEPVLKAEKEEEAGDGDRPEIDVERLGDLKSCLVDTLYGTNFGLNASGEVKAEIFELVSQLEAENPTKEPNQSEFLDGNWILLYTAFSELIPLVAIGTIPLLKVDKISQEINSKSMTIINATIISSPVATLSFSATASFEVRSPSRIQVRFKEGAFEPPKISSTINLPKNAEIFGQKISLSPLQQSLNPLQEAVASISRSVSGLPPLKVSIPGENTTSWLLTTFLDKDLRISRGDGGLFVLAKEGTTLLDQFS